MVKKELVPILRFPGFNETWEINNLQNITNKTISYGIVQTGENIEEGVPCVRVVDLTSNNLDSQLMIKTSEQISKSYSKTILELNEIMFALRGEIGLVDIVKSNLIGANLTRGVARISAKTPIIYPNFLLWCIRSPNSNDKINKRVNGSALKEIPLGELRKVTLSYPSIPEQQKIASFLTSVDKHINLLEKKKQALEQYKKGVMQKLFSQEIRFKDEHGNNYPDWEEKKLGEVFNFKQGVQCSVDYQFLIKETDMVRFIRIVDLTSKGEPIRYIQSVGDEHVINNDDLFMVRYGTPGIVGYGYNGTIANNLFRLLPKINLISKFYYFVFVHLYPRLSNLANSSTMPALNFGSLEILKTPVLDIHEQQKIANILSILDTKIELTNAQIEKSKEFKKGLLQKMFV